MITITPVNPSDPSPSPTPIPVKKAFRAAGDAILTYNEALMGDNVDQENETVTFQNMVDYGAALAAILKKYVDEE